MRSPVPGRRVPSTAPPPPAMEDSYVWIEAATTFAFGCASRDAPGHGGAVNKRCAAAVSRARRREWMTLNFEERRRRTGPGDTLSMEMGWCFGEKDETRSH